MFEQSLWGELPVRDVDDRSGSRRAVALRISKPCALSPIKSTRAARAGLLSSGARESIHLEFDGHESTKIMQKLTDTFLFSISGSFYVNNEAFPSWSYFRHKEIGQEKGQTVPDLHLQTLRKLNDANKIFAETKTFSDPRLDIKTINNSALGPGPVHDTSDLDSGLLRDQGADEIQGGIDASSDASSSDDAESTKTHRSTTSNRLATSIRALEGHAALSAGHVSIRTLNCQQTNRNIPGVGGAATVGPLAANIGVLILVAKLESQIVDDVANALDDVGALGQVALGSLAANILEADDGIGMGGGREARQDALLGQQ